MKLVFIDASYGHMLIMNSMVIIYGPAEKLQTHCRFSGE